MTLHARSTRRFRDISLACLLGIAVFVPASGCAQQPPKVTEPEFTRIPFLLDTSASLVPLERQPINTRTKVKAFGYGGAKVSSSFNEAKSPVRFKADQNIQFVVRLDTAGADPTALINLDVLKPGKNTREVVMAKAGAMGMSSKSTAGESAVSIDCAKYGEHSIRFVASQKLAPGEYVITVGGREGFLFGVD